MPTVRQKTAQQASNSATTARPGPKPAGRASRLAALGLHTDMDLLLHLPLRYEDETQLVPIADLLRSAGRIGGQALQVEGVVSACEVQYRPRRQLVVTLAEADPDADNPAPAGGAQLTLRFLNFYGSQLKQLAVGNRVRARGEVRIGFFGAEMVHPSYKIVNPGAPLPDSLTPVYPSGDGVPQAYLRRAIDTAIKRADWRDTLPPALRARLRLAPFEQSVRLLHNPPPDVDRNALQDRSHPAWVRMKFDELLAQQ
ncbi:MAG: ATP-dependent DNA helicase RecG, partial [Burkholderiaceae bacterium]